MVMSIDCPWDSSIDFNTDNDALACGSGNTKFQSILLSLVQSINHDIALYISNYYINNKNIKDQRKIK
jgi:hypothetical protein